jgi:hypothetical protein
MAASPAKVMVPPVGVGGDVFDGMELVDRDAVGLFDGDVVVVVPFPPLQAPAASSRTKTQARFNIATPCHWLRQASIVLAVSCRHQPPGAGCGRDRLSDWTGAW